MTQTTATEQSLLNLINAWIVTNQPKHGDELKLSALTLDGSKISLSFFPHLIDPDHHFYVWHDTSITDLSPDDVKSAMVKDPDSYEDMSENIWLHFGIDVDDPIWTIEK